MKLQTGLYATALALLALPMLVTGSSKSSTMAPVVSPFPSPTGRGHWEFELYKSKRCTGTAVKFIGNGSSDCRSDVPSGGAKGYNATTLDMDCTVTLYKDSRCSHGKKIANVFADNKSKCNSAGEKIMGYKVECL